MVRPGRDGVTHYSYGEGFLAHLPKEVRDSAEVTRSRPGRVSLPNSRQRPPSTHYSYGEGFLAHLPQRSEVRRVRVR